MNKEQYLEIVNNCKKIAFDVYAQNRQENDYLKDDAQYKISVLVWAICFLAAVFLFVEELDLVQFSEKHLLIIRWIIVGCLILNFLMSLVNYGTLPKDEIFQRYDELMRIRLNTYFKQLNQTFQDKCSFKVSENKNNALWIEVLIPRAKQMSFKESEMQKHVEYLNEREQIKSKEMGKG